MYSNINGAIVHNGQQYIGLNGDQYGPDWDKSTIPELFLVDETAQPTDPTLVVTGYHIDVDDTDPEDLICTQVWDTRSKTQGELDADLVNAKAAKKSEMESAYAAVAFATIMFTAAGSTSKSYDADQDAIKAIGDVLSVSGETPNGFYWVLADNTRETPFLKADVQGLADTIFARNSPYFQNLRDKKDEIIDAETLTEVSDVTW